ncbi:hypothetical protein [Streptomyces sp. NPDC058695]
MSELTGNRIGTAAGKLGLPHLAETITWGSSRGSWAEPGRDRGEGRPVP